MRIRCSQTLAGVLACAVVAGACSDRTRDEAATSTPPPVAATGPRFVSRCVDGDTTRQRHGSTCLCCHTDDFGVAGSVDPAGPPVDRVVVTDARGDLADVSPNVFFNFFRHFAMTPPLRVRVYGPDGRSVEMEGDAPSADCNACHAVGGSVGLIHGP